MPDFKFFDGGLRSRADGTPLPDPLRWFTHPRCRCHPIPEVPPMLYVFRWDRCAVHDYFGLQSQHWGADAMYEVATDGIRVFKRASTLAEARAFYQKLYPGDDRLPDAWRCSDGMYGDPGVPPPPDWPPAAAAVCPECKGEGRVLLFTGYSPCKTCGGNP